MYDTEVSKNSSYEPDTPSGTRLVPAEEGDNSAYRILIAGVLVFVAGLALGLAYL